MKVQVKLFAAAKELARRDCLEVDLPDGCRIAELRAAIAEQVPMLRDILSHAMFAVDTQYADDETALHAEAEVACIPPVSGG